MTSGKLKHKTACFNKKAPYLNYQDLELVRLFTREKITPVTQHFYNK